MALTLATVAAGGAWLEWQRRQVVPKLDVVPSQLPRLDLTQPRDLDAYMAASYLRILDLPAFKLVMADGDVFYHDGAGTVRLDRGPDENRTTWIYSRARTVQVVPISSGSRAWVVGPPEGVDPREQIFLAGSCCPVAPACESGWRYVGLEYVLGRPTHHVACGGDRWIDIQLGIPLRSRAAGTDPSSQEPASTSDGLSPPPPSAAPDGGEVAVLEIGPQPTELFAENPEGLRVMTQNEYMCAVGAGCAASVPGATPPTATGPPRATVQGDPPTDLARFVADLRTTYAPLPALEMIVGTYSVPGTTEERTRHRWDGVYRSVTEILDGGESTVAWLTIGGRTYEQWPPGRWHDYGPGGKSAAPEWPLGLPVDCPGRWEHRGFDIVADRTAHHLVCGLDEFWIDAEWLRVVRVQRDPDPLGVQTSVEELISLQFGPQPADLFVLPDGADVYCPSCAAPTSSGAPP
jgi:hypothetical protein